MKKVSAIFIILICAIFSLNRYFQKEEIPFESKIEYIGKLSNEEWLRRVGLNILAKKGYSRYGEEINFNDLEYYSIDIKNSPFKLFFPSKTKYPPTLGESSLMPWQENVDIKALNIGNFILENSSTTGTFIFGSIPFSGGSIEEGLEKVRYMENQDNPTRAASLFERYISFDIDGYLVIEKSNFWDMSGNEDFINANQNIIRKSPIEEGEVLFKRYLNFGPIMQQYIKQGKAKVFYMLGRYIIWVEKEPNKLYLWNIKQFGYDEGNMIGVLDRRE